MHPGLLLVNLGSPASPRTKDVKTYLQEFLSDPSVIEMPAALWQPLLRGIILPTVLGVRPPFIRIVGSHKAHH